MDDIEQAYRVLELDLETSTSMREVNQAYKDLVFIWHPDRIPSDRTRLCEKAEAKLKALNEARAFLRSQAKNGRLPAVKSVTAKSKTSKPHHSATRTYARNSRTYGSTYRPGDDSTYRPRRDTARTTANSAG
ncbi:MAG: J domain-containing protein, partial [Cyanobacteria bacterium J06627_28]